MENITIPISLLLKHIESHSDFATLLRGIASRIEFSVSEMAYEELRNELVSLRFANKEYEDANDDLKNQFEHCRKLKEELQKENKRLRSDLFEQQTKVNEVIKKHAPAPELDDEAKQLINGGKFIEAIKHTRARVREVHGYTPGLKEVKDLCDAYRAMPTFQYHG